MSCAPVDQQSNQSEENWVELKQPTFVCRDVYEETKLLPWTYSHVWFSFSDPVAKHLSDEAIRVIRIAEMYGSPNYFSRDGVRERLSRLREEYPSLKKVYINLILLFKTDQ
jgi:hypothetical protein